MQKEKIAIFGGSFNPIHNGHLWIAQTTINELSLDKVYFTPNVISPLKNHQQAFSPEHRIKMLEVALKTNPFFDICYYEIENTNSPSFTIDTVNYFLETFHYSPLYFIIGSDALLQLALWKDIEILLQKIVFVVHKRYDFVIPYQTLQLLKKYHRSFLFLESPILTISSSYIKRLIQQKKSFNYLVPEKVYDYIIENNLYM